MNQPAELPTEGQQESANIISDQQIEEEEFIRSVDDDVLENKYSEVSILEEPSRKDRCLKPSSQPTRRFSREEARGSRGESIGREEEEKEDSVATEKSLADNVVRESLPLSIEIELEQCPNEGKTSATNQNAVTIFQDDQKKQGFKASNFFSVKVRDKNKPIELSLSKVGKLTNGQRTKNLNKSVGQYREPVKKYLKQGRIRLELENSLDMSNKLDQSDVCNLKSGSRNATTIKHSRKHGAHPPPLSVCFPCQKSPQMLHQEREVKKMREKVYFFEFVRPLHQRQQTIQHQRESLFKQMARRAMGYREQDDEGDRRRSPAESQQEMYSQVKNYRISDYFKGTAKLSGMTRSIVHRATTTKGTSHSKAPAPAVDSSSLGGDKSPLHHQPEGSVSIFHSEKKKLKRELIDAGKALEVMKSIQKRGMQRVEVLKQRGRKGQQEGEQEEQNKWREVVEYVQSNPEQIMNMVPSPRNDSRHAFPSSSSKLPQSSLSQCIQIKRPSTSYQHYSKVLNQRRLKLTRYTSGSSKPKDLSGQYVRVGALQDNERLYCKRPQTTSNCFGRSNTEMGGRGKIQSQYSTQISNQHQALEGHKEAGVGTASGLQSYKGWLSSDGMISQIQMKNDNAQEVQDPSLQENAGRSDNNHSVNLQQETPSVQNLITSHSLLDNLKFPVSTITKHYNPERMQDTCSVQPVDLTVSSLQKRQKCTIRHYPNANMELRRKELQKLRAKAKIDISKELAGKLRVEEWKEQELKKKNMIKERHKSAADRASNKRDLKLLDWKYSPIRMKLLEGREQFNMGELDQAKHFKEDEIEYMLNLLRFKAKEFQQFDILKPLFNKSLNSLEKIMEDLMLGSLFDKISVKVLDISVESTLKLLMRCKVMLGYRKQVVEILKMIEFREAKMKALNYFVIEGDSAFTESNTDLKKKREDRLQEMVLELNQLTHFLMQMVRNLLGLKRIFGQVFVYDGMDYMKVVVNEMRQLKDTLRLFGIRMDMNTASFENMPLLEGDKREETMMNEGEKETLQTESFQWNLKNKYK